MTATISSAWGVPACPLCPEQCLEVGRAGPRRPHSPLLSASGPLLPLQGPKLFLGRVLVSEQTEGQDSQSGELRHGEMEAVNPKTLDWSQREGWPQNSCGQDVQGSWKAGEAREVGWGLAGGSSGERWGGVREPESSGDFWLSR